jgi:cephalosporin hydroxylase
MLFLHALFAKLRGERRVVRRSFPATDAVQPAGDVGQIYASWRPIAATLGLGHLSLPWEMEYQERMALTCLLEHLRPAVAIEIGTHDGGSLAVLSTYSKRVVSLDIDPSCRARLAERFPNTEFIVGSSRETLSPLLRRLSADRAALGFVLIDGDHSTAGARDDINDVLRFRPTHPMFVVMHDSFNPDVRRGIVSADWAANPHVHLVEVDFVPGVAFERTTPRGQMWGGLALALMLPAPRIHSLELIRRHEYLFQALYPTSPHALAQAA